jgi:chaperonin cofactor prefoldin
LGWLAFGGAGAENASVKLSSFALFAVAAALPCVVAQDAGNLPIKRVVLYKNGVGYFEHVGRVRDKQDVTIPFTSGQLNDVLKSLTVLDLDGGRITGVAYGSSAPVERQLGDLHLPAGDQKSAISELEARKEARDDETTKIFDDQQRLRENLKALKGSAEEKALLQRYTQQLNDQETRLEALRKEMAQLEQQVASAQEALDKTIAGLAFDVNL